MANTSARTLRLLSLLQSRRYWPGAELAGRLGRREVKLLGVTDFPIDGGVAPDLASAAAHAAEAPSPRLPGPDSRCPPLAPVRLEDLA